MQTFLRLTVDKIFGAKNASIYGEKGDFCPPGAAAGGISGGMFAGETGGNIAGETGTAPGAYSPHSWQGKRENVLSS